MLAIAIVGIIGVYADRLDPVFTTVVESGKIVLERRVIDKRSTVVSHLKKSLLAFTEAASSLITLSPDGKRVLIYAYRENGPKNHIWVVDSTSLRVIDEVSLGGKYVTTPFWLRADAVGFAEGDVAGRGLVITWDASGRFKRHYKETVGVPANAINGRQAADLVSGMGYRWPLINHGPRKFGASHFDDRVGKAVVDMDFMQIVIGARNPSMPESAIIVLLQRTAGTTNWRKRVLGSAQSPTFILSRSFLGVHHLVQGRFFASVYDINSGKVVFEVNADGMDIG